LLIAGRGLLFFNLSSPFKKETAGVPVDGLVPIVADEIVPVGLVLTAVDGLAPILLVPVGLVITVVDGLAPMALVPNGLLIMAIGELA